MSGPIESITGALLSKSLDASLSIHQVIAHNIANANSIGFRPLTVNFEQLMSDMKLAAAGETNVAELKDRLAGIQIEIESDANADTVQLDQQMVLLTKTPITRPC